MSKPSSTHASEHEKVGPAQPPSPGQSNVFSWDNITFSTKSRSQQLTLLNAVSGFIRGGEMLAVMGPSGSGKTTLLDALAGRKAVTSGSTFFNGEPILNMQAISSYVEQEDALLGVLTVAETLSYTTRLGMPNLSAADVQARVQDTLIGLGLSHVANNIIGTPIQRGVSGGQKRRVTIGNALVMLPKVLLLDEPTSGLDANTAYEVLLKIRSLAITHNIAVVCTIHSPNWETFSLFEKALFLARGQPMYFGPVQQVDAYFTSLGHPCPRHSNPADHVLSLISTDFQNAHGGDDTANEIQQQDDRRAALDELHAAETGNATTIKRGELDRFAQAYRQHAEEQPTLYGIAQQAAGTAILVSHGQSGGSNSSSSSGKGGRTIKTVLKQTMVLTQRNLLNYRRNLLAYGIRIGMFAGMAAMMAAIWTRMPLLDNRINDRLSIHFFGVAILAFMAVAGVPAFLEERAVMLRERKNNLYTAAPFVVANSVATAPFLFLCSVLFAIILYWSIGLHPGAGHFFRFLAYVFLGVYAAECQALLIAALLPIFVAALAISAFANGFMMSVQGYFLRNIPAFWQNSFHYADYQTYAFQLLVRNDLTGLIFPCTGELANNTCQCSFPSQLVAAGQQCAVRGEDVIDSLRFADLSSTASAFILVGIIVVYRLLFWAVLARSK